MFDHIKTILKNKNEKCIIVEDGKPCWVVIPYEEYLHLNSGDKAGFSDNKIRETFTDLPFGNGNELGLLEGKKEPPLRLEDLPF